MCEQEAAVTLGLRGDSEGDGVIRNRSSEERPQKPGTRRSEEG